MDSSGISLNYSSQSVLAPLSITTPFFSNSTSFDGTHARFHSLLGLLLAYDGFLYQKLDKDPRRALERLDEASSHFEASYNLAPNLETARWLADALIHPSIGVLRASKGDRGGAANAS